MGMSESANGILNRFHLQVSEWFEDVFAEPTEVQREAWDVISQGQNALVVAPTGSGKTLASFLWALNTLVGSKGELPLLTAREVLAGAALEQPRESISDAELVKNSPTKSPTDPKTEDKPENKTDTKAKGVRVLYVSPLKALGVDVERNLQVPLAGIARKARELGLESPDIRIGVRSGDTPQSERNKQVTNPPDILITTPESLYLLLTSKAQRILHTVHTVIIDEIHAVAGTKRGAHLALSLERLPSNPQRIGLSATVTPLERVAQFLGGARPVAIVAPPAEKRWDLNVDVPVADLADLPVKEAGSPIGEITVRDPFNLVARIPTDAEDDTLMPWEQPGYFEDPSLADDAPLPTIQGPGTLEDEGADKKSTSIWPFIEESVYQRVMAANSTLIFVNSRRSAERLTAKLNELYAAEHAPESITRGTQPAAIIGFANHAPAVIARAHHGSVAKDERAEIERLLKAGELKAVVATSSLELGIDMGAVEEVIQVEAPPSVAAGLQRVGRAGHTVGAVSTGIFYPKHRSDLIQSTVVAAAMRAGEIEELKVPMNPLDVLAQQTVAAVVQADIAGQELTAEGWYETVRGAYNYHELDREVFDSVIDLVTGVYPSTDFADLKARVELDEITGALTPRRGAARVAVTSGGTIPDRGLFGVFLAGGGPAAGEEDGAPGPDIQAAGNRRGTRRVGELDEEMVYESRVGDVFTLGASSWRIVDITRDQVLVEPAPGQVGRLPFWTGDSEGRPFQLGLAIGRFRRQLLAGTAEQPDSNDFARDNATRYIKEQEEATGVVPDERTLLLERFTDEVGDWRVILHTPYGKPVNSAWALAVGARITADTGIDAQAMAADDGIVLRLPQGTGEEPGPELFRFEEEELERLVTEAVGNSALFAARFRECAARALLMPRTNPGKRAPLWQQRQRAAQLLDVAKQYPSFPIILETVRECIQDVYDLESLKEVLADLASRQLRIAQVTTAQPSPFASSLLFNYTSTFMYEGDSPAAERRAAALALDPALLEKLLGGVNLRELLDPAIIQEISRSLHYLDRPARDPEELTDRLRTLGPIPVAEIGEYIAFDQSLIAEAFPQIMQVRIAKTPHYAASTDAAVLRDGLAIPVPAGVGAAPELVADALAQLIRRYARTHGPFTVEQLAAAFGLGVATAHTALQQLIGPGQPIVAGTYTAGVTGTEYCDSQVLARIRAKSLAAARAETEPVSTSAYARFLGELHTGRDLYGADGTYAAIEQLAGVPIPASAWESLVLPARVADYQPGFLDELCAAGDIVIVGMGQAAAGDPWLMLLPVEEAAWFLPLPDAATPDAPAAPTPDTPTPDTGVAPGLHDDLLATIRRGGGFSFHDLLTQVPGYTSSTLREAIWQLVDEGLVCPDSFAAIRARAHTGAPSRSTRTAHRTTRRPSARTRSTPPDMVGRFYAAPTAPHLSDETTQRAAAWGRAWLDRYGVVTRGAVMSEDVVGGFALAYKTLSAFENYGQALRGMFVADLGAAQFATRHVIDRLRRFADSPDIAGWPSGTREPVARVVAAADPMNPYGAALAWPVQAGLTRGAGALVVLIDGLLAAHVTRGGRTLTLTIDAPELVLAALTDAVASGRVSPFVVERITLAFTHSGDGTPITQPEVLPATSVFASDYAARLRAAGAKLNPRGLHISGQAAPEEHRPAQRDAYGIRRGSPRTYR